MNKAYVTVGIKIKRLFLLLFNNKFGIHPKYFFRLFLIFQSAIWSSIFSLVENIRYHKKILALPPPQAPVFIIGHWRTGSTFLHQLLSLDPRFTTPSVFQVTVPDCFISIEKYYKPVMKKMMGNKRPMDNVKFGPDAPQEDEFALYRMTLNSPLKDIVFPKKSKSYFLSNSPQLIPYQKKIKQWEKALVFFYKKLLFKNPNKTLLIKNPFHSKRLDILNRLFPDALFIHIYRNPLDVIPSTIRMWHIIATQNYMCNGWQKPSVHETALFYTEMLKDIKLFKKKTESDRFIEIKYETLEQNPLDTINKIYAHFNFDVKPDYITKLSDFLEEERGFVKNTHQLSDTDKKIIKEACQDFMLENAYSF